MSRRSLLFRSFALATATVTAGALLATGIGVGVASASPATSLNIRLLSTSGAAVTGTYLEAYPVVDGVVQDSYDQYGNVDEYDSYPVHGKAGQYEIDLPGSGEYTLFLDGTGAKGTAGQWLGGGQTEDFARVLTVGDGVNSMDISYAPSGAISGTVKGSSGKGVADICVQLWSFDGAKWNYLDGTSDSCDAETNSKGAYSINPGAAGSYKVQFQDEDGRYLTRFADGAKDEADSSPIYVATNKSMTVNTTLTKGGVISGQLTSASGTPDAIVEPYLLTGTPGSFTGATLVGADYYETDGHGKFVVPGLEPGYYVLGYEVYDDVTGNIIPGFLGGTTPLNSTVYQVVAATTTAVPTYDLDYPAGSSGVVVATVTAQGGGSLSGISGEVFVVNGTTQQAFPVSSASGNVYTFRDIPAGDYDVIAFVQSDDGFLFGPNTTPVTVGTGTVSVSLELSPPADPLSIATDPSIPDGPLTVGVPVLADPGTASDASATASYQWYRIVDGARQLIRGAQDASYTPVAGDVGDALAVRVTHTLASSFYELVPAQTVTAIATSDSTVDSSGVIIGNTIAPTIANPTQARVGGTVVASGGSWSPAGAKLSYQWLSDGTAIGGATQSHYTPTVDDLSQFLSVEVKATKSGYVDSAWVPSEAVQVDLGEAATVAKAPKVTSKTSAGVRHFTATPGTWSTTGDITYEWAVDTDNPGDPDGAVQRGPDPTFSTSSTHAVTLTVVDTTVDRLQGRYTFLAGKGALDPIPATVYDELGYPSSLVSDSAPVGHGVMVLPSYEDAPNGSSLTETQRLQERKGSKWVSVGHSVGDGFVPVSVSLLGHSLRVQYTLSNPSYASVVGYSASFVGIANDDLDGQGSVVIPTSRPFGATLTGTVNGYPSGVKHSYRWQVSTDSGNTWTDIPKATGASLTLKAPLAVGNEVRLAVKTTLAGSTATTVPSNASTIDDNYIHNLTVPRLSASGPLKVGATVSTSNGTWDVPGMTYTYQWQSSPDDSTWSAIPGATKSSYKTVVADAGDSLRVNVTAHKSGYDVDPGDPDPSNVAVSAGISIVADPTDRIVIHPQFLAGAQYTQPVVAPDYEVVFTTETGLDTVKVTYQWKLNGKSIKSATGATYTPALGDIGKKLSVELSLTSGVYGSARFTTAGTTVQKADALPVLVDIVGTGTPGSTLTADPSVSGTGLTLRWQLSSDGATYTAISGATKSTYLVPLADAGKHIRLTASYAPSGHATSTASDDLAIGYVGSITGLTAPAISSPQVGVATTVDTGNWDTSALTFTYQWYLGDTAIPGATGATFTPLGSDVGGDLRVTVTASRVGYVSGAQTSNADSVAVGATLAPGAHAIVTGSAKTCSTLTVTAGSWNVSGIVVGYQWLANGSQIEGATDRTYVIPSTSVGVRFSVWLTASATGYGSGAYPTAQTAAVTAGSGCF